VADIEPFNATLRDLYPQPGARIKQWVVDERRERAWEVETCPRFDVNAHEDDTAIECRNSYGRVSWVDLNHDCCHTCGDRYEELRGDAAVIEWLAEKAKRPAVCQDRAKLSDEVAEDVSLRLHPSLAMLLPRKR
jgi:hypothetical protein